MSDNKLDLDVIVEKIAEYKGAGSIPYLDKFNKTWISSIIEESNSVKLIKEKFHDYEHTGVDVFAFVRIFLNILPHTEDETLYLTVTLIDLFKNISDAYSLESHVNSNDIVNYVVENVLNKNNKTHLIQTRKLPEQKKFQAESTRVREIDIDAPLVYGNIESNIRRLSTLKIKSDSTHHNNNGIKKACFGATVKKIFTLDSLSDNICLFNLNCVLEKRIVPLQAKLNQDLVILDFTWSDTQQRIGATIKDWSLSFWEANDNFELEKNFSTANFVPDQQQRIWYIQFLNVWVSTDITYSLHVWDLEKESKAYSLSSNVIQGNIIDLVPLSIIKLVAVCSNDKLITIWSFQKRRVLMKMSLTDGIVHTMVWSDIYQVLVTGGYETKIKVWNLDQASQDISLMGKLVGHASRVIGIEFVEKTSMLVSVDDSGHLKIWDIRNLNCVQTLNIDVKTINKLIDISKFGKMALIGNRITLLNFEEANTQLNPLENKEQLWPIKVDYYALEDQIVVCTRKDIRFFDAYSGKVQKIYVGLLNNDESDISVFKLMNQSKNFILGDDKGEINIYNTNTGERIKPLASHQNEVTAIKFDYANNLIISAGDSTIYIQKETKTGFELKRAIKNLHFNRGINIAEASIYHNLILTSSNNNTIFVWDYEYIRLLACIQTFQNSEASFISFINGYSIIIIGDTAGKIHFLHLKRREIPFISFVKIGEIDIEEENDSNLVYATKILVDLEANQENSEIINCKIYLATNKGQIRIYDILDIIKRPEIKFIPHSNARSSYNCNRNLEEDFLKAIETYKLYIFDLNPSDKVDPFITSTQTQPQVININNQLIKTFKAHSDCLTTLVISYCPNKRLITSSLDSHIKIWTMEGILQGSLNINYPLPISWNLDVKDKNQYKKKIFYALKVLDQIVKKNKKDMFVEEEKKISVNLFLKYLSSSEPQKIVFRQPFAMLENEIRYFSQEDPKKKILLMKDEYSPRDLQYDKVKNIYQKDLQGPSLRQMEVLKKLSSNQNTMNSRAREIASQKIQENEKNDKLAEEERQRQEFISFLVGDARNKMLEQNDHSVGVKMLSHKLDLALQNQNKASKLEILQLSSKPSVNSATRRRATKLKWPLAVNPHEVPSDNTPSSVKTFLTPLDDPFSSRLGFHGTLSSLVTPAKSTLFSPANKPQGNKSKDFFAYAKKKIEAHNADPLPMLTRSISVGRQGLHSEAYERKLKKKNFHDILNKLNQTKRIFQNSSNRLFRAVSQSSAQENLSTANSRLQEPVSQIENTKTPILMDYRSFLEKKREITEEKPFLEELGDFKTYIQETWNLNKDEKLPNKTGFGNVAKSQKNTENAREFIGNYSKKMKEILKDVVTEQQKQTP